MQCILKECTVLHQTPLLEKRTSLTILTRASLLATFVCNQSFCDAVLNNSFRVIYVPSASIDMLAISMDC